MNSPADEGPTADTSSRLLVVAMWAVPLLVTWWSFAPLLREPFVFDDLALLDYVAKWRIGDYGVDKLFLLPHNEHFIPALRGLAAASTWLVGADASWLRMLCLVVHALGACAAGRLVVAAGEPAWAGLWAATLYAAVGRHFGGSAVWIFTSAAVMLSWVATLWAVERLSGPRSRPSSALVLAFGGLSASTGALPGLASVVAALAGDIFAADRNRRTRARRMLGITLGLGALLALLAALLYRRFAPHAMPLPAIEGLFVTGGLLLQAPGRVVTALDPWLSASWAVVLGWLLLMGGLWRASPGLRRRAAVVFAGALALSVAVGLARPGTAVQSLPTIDRYFYPLLAPLVIVLAAWLSLCSRPWSRTLALVLALTPAAFARQDPVDRHWRPEVELPGYRSFWREIDLLAEMVRFEALAQPREPWHLTNGVIFGRSTTAEQMSLAAIVRTNYPRPLASESFTLPGPADEARLNGVLDRWAVARGLDSSPVCARHGRLGPPVVGLVTWLDFRTAGHDDQIQGAERWSPPMRWMNEGATTIRLPDQSGQVTVRYWLPALPGAAGEPLDIRLDAELDGALLGSAIVEARGGEGELSFARGAAAVGRREVTLKLRARPSWRPVDLLARSLDPRRLSLALLAVGFREAGKVPPTPPGVRCLAPAPGAGERSGPALRGD